MSGAALEAGLCVDEDTFDKFGWYSFPKTLHLRGERHLWLTIVRYVDDVFVATRWFCPDCVEHIIFCMYSKTVTFDPANDGKGSVSSFNVARFLDLLCGFLL